MRTRPDSNEIHPLPPTPCTAYLLPLLHRLGLNAASERTARLHSLVLVPTAELAHQVHEVAREYARDIAGVARLTKGDTLSLTPETALLVATPGALRTYDPQSLFASTRAVVLDEADLLLSPSFGRDMKVWEGRLCYAVFLFFSECGRLAGVARLTKGDTLSLTPETGLLVATPGALRTYVPQSLFASTRAVVLDEVELLLSPSFGRDMKVREGRWCGAVCPVSTECVIVFLVSRRTLRLPLFSVVCM